MRRRRWIEAEEFGELFAACNLVPGPASTQLALLLGRRRAGWPGMALTAVLFIGPAVLVMLVLGEVYDRIAGVHPVAAALLGIDAAVVGILASAVVDLSGLGRRRLPTLLVAAAACAAGLRGLPQLAILAGGAVAGTVLLAPGSLRLPGARSRLPLLAALPHAGGAALPPLFLAFLKVGALAVGSGYVLLPLLHAEVAGAGLGIDDHRIADGFGVAQATTGPVFAAAAFLGVRAAGIPGGLVAAVALTLAHGILTGVTGIAAALLALVLLRVRPGTQPLAVLLGAVVGLAALLPPPC